MRAVIVGTGQVGFAIIGALSGENADVVAIDVSEDSLGDAREQFDIQTICGSGSNPTNLVDAGIASADMLVAVTDSDEVNMVACSIAAMKAPHAIRVARIRETAFLKDETVLGNDGFRVTHAINPEMVTAKRLTDILEVPIATDVAELGHGLQLVGVRVPAYAAACGKSFAALRNMAPELKMLVTTRIRSGESIVPKGNDDVQAGDVLYTVISPSDLPQLAELLSLPWRPAKRITIAGGTGIGFMLAKTLEASSKSNIKLIESDAVRANELAMSLSKILVLQGNPTDENLLVEENIRDCDVFIAALKDEEANVMAALNAKRLGAHRVITLTNKTGYIPIIENAGVDAVVSPQALAIGTILHYVRQGRVKSVTPYGMAGKAEIIECEALETAKIVGTPLKDVKMPKSAIIGALIRNGKAIIPGGNDIIQPGDRVFVFTEKEAIKKLEKMISVSLSFF
ncbi:MAG: Trk system potassium transporter TrkA [Deltaproteobacteria bacterium]|nr:Trk system potassium transporter TrkA [Deltaproteobacteria bacterium]MBN2673824.1 Trk system potassium transporter TrkA [Deltaproteobacteria bacterium]